MFFFNAERIGNFFVFFVLPPTFKKKSVDTASFIEEKTAKIFSAVFSAFFRRFFGGAFSVWCNKKLRYVLRSSEAESVTRIAT